MSGTFRLRVLRRAVVVPLLLAFTLTLLPAPLPAADDDSTDPSTRDRAMNFVDKWVINGNAIGNAIGAVAGQMLFAMCFGGPFAIVAGSILGSIVGGYIGAAIDDRMGIAVNYAAFNRPPLTQGGTWLSGVGPYEQFFYQIDNWVINGGNIAGLSVHFLLNAMARTIPGLGILASPILLAVSNYVAGTIADNMDGLVDLGLIGRKIDSAKGLSPTVVTSDGATEATERPDFGIRDAYDEVLYQMRHGTQDSLRSAYDGFKTVKQAMGNVIRSTHGTAVTSAP